MPPMPAVHAKPCAAYFALSGPGELCTKNRAPQGRASGMPAPRRDASAKRNETARIGPRFSGVAGRDRRGHYYGIR